MTSRHTKEFSNFSKNSNFQHKFKDESLRAGGKFDEHQRPNKNFGRNSRNEEKGQFTRNDEINNRFNRNYEKYQSTSSSHNRANESDENARKIPNRKNNELRENLENKLKFQECFGIDRRFRSSRRVDENPQYGKKSSRHELDRESDVINSNVGQFKDLRELLNNKRKQSHSSDITSNRRSISSRLGPRITDETEQPNQITSTEHQSTSAPVKIRKPVRIRNPLNRLADLVRLQVVDAVEKNQKRGNSTSSSSKSGSQDSLIEISSSSTEYTNANENKDASKDSETCIQRAKKRLDENFEEVSSNESENWLDMMEDEDEDFGNEFLNCDGNCVDEITNPIREESMNVGKIPSNVLEIQQHLQILEPQKNTESEASQQPSTSKKPSNHQNKFEHTTIMYHYDITADRVQQRTPSPSTSNTSSSSVTDLFGAPSKLEARLRKIRGDVNKFSDGNKSSSMESLKSNGFNANAKAFYPKKLAQKHVIDYPQLSNLSYQPEQPQVYVPEQSQYESFYYDSHHSFYLSPYVDEEPKKISVESDKLTHDQMINLLYVTKTAPKYLHEALSYYMEYYDELGLDLCKSAVDEVLIAKGIEFKSSDFTLLS